MNKIKHEHDKLIKEHHEQKQKFEIQLGELNKRLLQVLKNWRMCDIYIIEFGIYKIFVSIGFDETK